MTTGNVAFQDTGWSSYLGFPQLSFAVFARVSFPRGWSGTRRERTPARKEQEPKKKEHKTGEGLQVKHQGTGFLGNALLHPKIDKTRQSSAGFCGLTKWCLLSHAGLRSSANGRRQFGTDHQAGIVFALLHLVSPGLREDQCQWHRRELPVSFIPIITERT